MPRYRIDNTPAELDFSAGDTAERIAGNCKNLLLCRMGEVPYDRLRGMNPAIFELPFGKMRDELLPELDRVMLWEPRAQVEDADATLTESGEVLICVTLEINA